MPYMGNVYTSYYREWIWESSWGIITAISVRHCWIKKKKKTMAVNMGTKGEVKISERCLSARLCQRLKGCMKKRIMPRMTSHLGVQ